MLNDEYLPVCQHAIKTLFDRYGWTALTNDELTALLRNAIQQNGLSKDLEQQALQCYTLALYAICTQTSDLARRERGFTDLFHYLYRLALRCRYAEADELAQRALVLVYEKLDSCRFPAAFLQFAKWKLIQVARDYQRQLDREQVLPALSEPSELIERNAEQLLIEDALIDQEGQVALLAALRRLPARQQQTVMLKYFHRWSDTEIGAHLQITVNNVRVSRCHAIALLREDQSLQAFFASADEHEIL